MMDQLTAPVPGVAFGPFRLFAAERLLEKDGVALGLGSRALDILIVLVEHAGEVVGKNDLIARAWPNLTVEESSLRVHIAGLRRALGDGHGGARYVTNVPGRGYCFVAPVTRISAPTASSIVAPAPASTAQAHKLPPRLARMVGRDETIRLLTEKLTARRFVTIHGPGGIGKTTVAIAVGHALLASFAGEVRFFDLGAISDPYIVPSAIASALGLMAQASDPTPSLVAFLRRRRMVLILDSCEHVIEAVAALAERIFQEASEVYILATSREALRVEGELVYRLPALDSPPESIELSAAQIQSFPAAALLVERAAASGHFFQLTDAEAPIVAAICRKLDGIALAIELAARHVGTYGLHETAALLDNRLGLLWRGRRTALPRHQTLNATLEWSYDLLTEAEQTVLRRLSVFIGPFSLEAAHAVAADEELKGEQIVETVAALVGKSLVSSGGDTEIRYRLLDTTRHYAFAKLAASDEASSVGARHAAYYRELLEAERNSGSAVNAEHLGNIRAALQWAFSEQGNARLGTALATAAAATFIEMSLLSECCYWVERALPILDDTERGTRREMELQSSLGMSLIYSKGSSEQAHTALNRALRIADALGDRPSQFRLLERLHAFHRRAANFIRALDVARQSEAVAKQLSDPTALVTAHSLLGASFHLLGFQADARHHLEAALTQPSASHFDSVGLGRDYHHSRTRIALARTLWLHGYPDQALRLAHQTIAETRGHPVTISIVLTWAICVFHWAGDLESAETCIHKAIAHAGTHSLSLFQTAALGMRGELLIKRGDVVAGMELVRTSLEALHADRYEMYTASLTGSLASGLATAGRFEEAISTIDGIITEAQPSGGLVDLPELLRLRGTVLDQIGDLEGAERCFLQSSELATRQSAPSWQLRTSINLACLRLKQDRRAEAHDLLAAAYAHFSEGFGTADLKAAKQLLDDMARPSSPARVRAKVSHVPNVRDNQSRRLAPNRHSSARS